MSAFLDPNLQNIISSKGGIAVTLVQWSGGAQQSQSIAWTLINDSASAIAFSNAVGAMGRPFSGLTAIGTAINYSAGLFAGNGFEGERLVIDISGDGERNNGDSVTTARDAAAALDIYINGLPIINEVPTLESYYINNVITGTGSFTVEATNYSVFAPSILQKLTLEATNAPSIASEVPEPGSMGLALAGLGLLAAFARRRSAR